MIKLRVLIADDHAILREGLALLIAAQPDMEVVAMAAGGREAVNLACQHHPDLVVLDVSMPDLRGAEAAEQIRLSCPQVHVLALTRHADQGYLRQMLSAGARGYVLKRSASAELVDAIRIVAAGGAYVDSGMAGTHLSHAFRTPRTGELHCAGNLAAISEREQQVLKLIALGQSNKGAASELGLSVKTVESYRASAVEKLQLRGRTDIVRYAVSQRWLGDDDEAQ